MKSILTKKNGRSIFLRILAEEMDQEKFKSQFDQEEHHSSDINCYILYFTNV